MKLQLGKFGLARSQIFTIQIRAFLASPQKKKCGQKKKWNHDEVREAVKEIPLHHKRTLRDLAGALGMPLT
jgi:hypothetical protein